ASLRAWGLAGAALIGALMLWRWFRRDDDLDAAWIGIISGSLLAAPVGWVYYAPLLIGPFAGRHRSALLWIAYGLLCLPFGVLAAWSHSRAWNLTVGSAYFFGFLVLFVASCCHKTRNLRTARIPDPARRREGPARELSGPCKRRIWPYRIPCL